ncbi:MAG: hypothetical protein ACRDNW_00315, partial [Trebonia sp.]
YYTGGIFRAGNIGCPRADRSRGPPPLVARARHSGRTQAAAASRRNGCYALTAFIEIGFGVALGVLLGTVVVCSVLVTALNLDLGRRVW